MATDSAGETNSAGTSAPAAHAGADRPNAAPPDTTALVQAQLAHAVGLAMQNIVAQRQALNTINLAVVARALAQLAERDPAIALAEARKQLDATTASAVDALTRLAGLVEKGHSTPAEPGPSDHGSR